MRLLGGLAEEGLARGVIFQAQARFSRIGCPFTLMILSLVSTHAPWPRQSQR